MKKLILDLSSLTSPFPKETLYAYLTVAAEAVSAILLTDRKGRQCPIQYISMTLNKVERNYAPMEKLALSLIHMTRRLRRYFEAHPVKVIMDQSIKHILSKTETSGKLAKYVVELEAYNITFVPRNDVKGLVLIGPISVEYTYDLRFTFPSTNNEAEYEALLVGLRIARKMDISNIEVRVDSKLVASQINENYEASKDNMIKYLAKAKERETTAIREARYKKKMEQYYNKKAYSASFRPGEFVFRRNEASRVEDQGKLGPKWEGPYRVVEAYENDS
ncbi:reverse transcriptase domain-containing protein [Tanacetum coccineum]